MGCSATRNAAVEPFDDYGDIANGNREVRTIPVSARPNHKVLEGEDIPAELLESNAVSNIQKGQNGLSFEINLDEANANDNSTQKQPPKRIQERLDEKPSSPITLDKVQEKLEEAEIRRQQILAQRVQSAKHKNHARKQSSAGSNFEIDDPNQLKVPHPNSPRTPNPYDVSYI